MAGKRTHVTGQLSRSPKDGHSQEIEMADAPQRTLAALLARRRADAFRSRREMCPFAHFPELSESTDRKAVQQALGHESIAMTVDTYGPWLPVEPSGAVNVLAEGLASELAVTSGAKRLHRRRVVPEGS